LERINCIFGLIRDIKCGVVLKLAVGGETLKADNSGSLISIENMMT
jgi:hypothetical protein